MKIIQAGNEDVTQFIDDEAEEDAPKPKRAPRAKKTAVSTSAATTEASSSTSKTPRGRKAKAAPAADAEQAPVKGKGKGKETETEKAKAPAQVKPKPKPKPKRQPSPPPTTDAVEGNDDDDEPLSGKRPKHSFKSVTLAEAIASSSSASRRRRSISDYVDVPDEDGPAPEPVSPPVALAPRSPHASVALPTPSPITTFATQPRDEDHIREFTPPARDVDMQDASAVVSDAVARTMSTSTESTGPPDEDIEMEDEMTGAPEPLSADLNLEDLQLGPRTRTPPPTSSPLTEAPSPEARSPPAKRRKVTQKLTASDVLGTRRSERITAQSSARGPGQPGLPGFQEAAGSSSGVRPRPREKRQGKQD